MPGNQQASNGRASVTTTGLFRAEMLRHRALRRFAGPPMIQEPHTGRAVLIGVGALVVLTCLGIFLGHSAVIVIVRDSDVLRTTAVGTAQTSGLSSLWPVIFVNVREDGGLRSGASGSLRLAGGPETNQTPCLRYILDQGEAVILGNDTQGETIAGGAPTEKGMQRGQEISGRKRREMKALVREAKPPIDLERMAADSGTEVIRVSSMSLFNIWRFRREIEAICGD